MNQFTAAYLQHCINEAFKGTEEPTMTYEEAMIIARYGAGHCGTNQPARKKLRKEAIELLTTRAEELMRAAEKKAEAERTLVDIQVYENNPMSTFRMWVKRVFSDGHETKTLEEKPFALQLKHAFEQGKKAAELARAQAGAQAAKEPRYEGAV